MEASMEEKMKRVVLWLKRIHGDLPVPRFEVTAKTVHVLYELAQHNEARNKDFSLLIENMKQRATEYEAETKSLQDLLVGSLNYSPWNMSREGISNLNVLVKSAMALQTKDTCLTSFFSAINDMTSKLYETESENRKMGKELKDIGKKATAALLLENGLEKELEEAEKLVDVYRVRAEIRSQTLKFLKTKSVDFKIRIKAFQEQIIKRGLDQSLTHESLMNLSEDLAELQADLVPLKKKLKSYLDLPPSLPLARVKTEEVKRELEGVDNELTNEIDKLTRELL